MSTSRMLITVPPGGANSLLVMHDQKSVMTVKGWTDKKWVQFQLFKSNEMLIKFWEKRDKFELLWRQRGKKQSKSQTGGLYGSCYFDMFVSCACFLADKEDSCLEPIFQPSTETALSHSFNHLGHMRATEFGGILPAPSTQNAMQCLKL